MAFILEDASHEQQTTFQDGLSLTVIVFHRILWMLQFYLFISLLNYSTASLQDHILPREHAT